MNIARSLLINSISNFTAYQVYNNRSGLVNQLTQDLRNGLNQENCNLQGFQIINILMPSDYAAALYQTQVRENL